jgi:acyl transferase domain-containing protein
VHGAFIDRVQQFAPSHFGITTTEADSMDPQQRLILEVGYEALNHAAYHKGTLLKKAIGVFVGQATYDWLTFGSMLQNSHSPCALAIGFAPPIIANRVSFVLGLTGPSMAVDTACSSSLVALQLGSLSMRTGSAQTSMVAGVNLQLHPKVTDSFNNAHMLSAIGRCATFE